MNLHEHDLESLEAELRQARPATPPADFLRRLQAITPPPAKAAPPQPVRSPAAAGTVPGWRSLVLRWLVPAAALVVLGFLAWRIPAGNQSGHVPAGAPMRADNVQIDQELVSTFDTVAALPDGEPVRFRCREWMDEVVVRDTRRGLEVARRVPRVEVIPVRFETY